MQHGKGSQIEQHEMPDLGTAEQLGDRGEDVFVGSDTQLVAPVTVGNGVTIAAGTTVTRNIADNELVLSRVPQVHKQGWQRPVKKK